MWTLFQILICIIYAVSIPLGIAMLGITVVGIIYKIVHKDHNMDDEDEV